MGLEDFLKTWFVISVRKLLKIEGMENALLGANVKMCEVERGRGGLGERAATKPWGSVAQNVS
jgi:hypothetical protein